MLRHAQSVVKSTSKCHAMCVWHACDQVASYRCLAKDLNQTDLIWGSIATSDQALCCAYIDRCVTAYLVVDDSDDDPEDRLFFYSAVHSSEVSCILTGVHHSMLTIIIM